MAHPLAGRLLTFSSAISSCCQKSSDGVDYARAESSLVQEADHAFHDHAQERSEDRGGEAAADGARPQDGRVHRRVRRRRVASSTAPASAGARRARASSSATGECTAKHGPYRGEHELPAATLLLKVRTREEAIGWAERYGKILGDGELELGKVNEPWDIGLMPAPENPPLQMLLIEKADQATEGGGRSPQQKAALSRLKTEMTKAGVLVRSLRLQPSAKGKRLVFTNNDLRVHRRPVRRSRRS